VISRQKTDCGCGSAHQQQRHQKSVLASDQIADASKKQRAERSHNKANGKGHQVSDHCHSVVSGRIKQRRDDGGQRAENIKIVPFDHRPDSGSDDDAPDVVFLRRMFKRRRSGGFSHCWLGAPVQMLI
jgi:hypothetical protein